VALSMINSDVAGNDDGFHVEILGDMRPAARSSGPIFDPNAERMRG